MIQHALAKLLTLMIGVAVLFALAVDAHCTLLGGHDSCHDTGAQ